MKQALLSLTEHLARDIGSIAACVDCYGFFIKNPRDYFTRVCSKPHLLVFAKLDFYPYWPAKVMSVDENIANVEFFGDHTQEDIPFDKCYLYSKDFLNKSPKDKNLIDAMKVILLRTFHENFI